MPTLLTPHNKYAIIYPRAAGSQEAEGKHPALKSLSHAYAHTHCILLCLTLKNTHITCLLKGTLNDPVQYVCTASTSRDVFMWICMSRCLFHIAWTPVIRFYVAVHSHWILLWVSSTLQIKWPHLCFLLYFDAQAFDTGVWCCVYAHVAFHSVSGLIRDAEDFPVAVSCRNLCCKAINK